MTYPLVARVSEVAPDRHARSPEGSFQRGGPWPPGLADVGDLPLAEFALDGDIDDVAGAAAEHRLAER